MNNKTKNPDFKYVQRWNCDQREHYMAARFAMTIEQYLLCIAFNRPFIVGLTS